jgi:hypothetical protein
VGRVLSVAGFGVLAAWLVVAAPGFASLYSPEDPFAIPVGEDGKAGELPFDEFKRRLAVLTNALVEPKAGEKANPDRQRFLDRIARKPDPASPEARSLSTSEAAALATDLLRVGKSDKALDLLAPRTRRPDYFVLSVLGHVFAARGDWANALKYHTEERFDLEMPATPKGLSKGQRDWWAKLDTGYLDHFYRVRKREADGRRSLTPAELDRANETEDVLPLFPLPTGPGDTAAPVRFVNDTGGYEPGRLAPAERAKLPADAVAVVQQLLLWFPGETRLYWLLAELYAAEGDLDAAVAILDECAWSRQYGNRKVLMEHRTAVRTALDSRPRPEPEATATPPEPPPPEEPPISLRAIGLYFAVVGVIALIAFVRAITRRVKRADCGPIG